MFLDSRVLQDLAAKGMCLHEIAAELDQPYYRVRKSVQLLNIEVRLDPRGRRGKEPEVKPVKERAPKQARPDGNLERDQRMVAMYRQGLTLEKIGQTFGITRERVRQVLKKLGIAASDGGAAKSARSKASAKTAKQDARYLARHGLTFDQYKEVRGTGLLLAYRNQENAAKGRGIEWGLNLAQWLDVWRTSGKLGQRGRGKGKYVMSRIKDTGGYVIGNVHIQLATENSLEAVEKWRGKFKATRGVFLLYPGMSTPYMAKVGRHSLGLFATEDEAAAARMKFINSNGYSIGRDGCARLKAA